MGPIGRLKPARLRALLVARRNSDRRDRAADPPGPASPRGRRRGQRNGRARGVRRALRSRVGARRTEDRIRGAQGRDERSLRATR